MIVYFVTQKNMGDRVTLEPRVPDTAPDREGELPRICVSCSILGALSSVGENLGLMCKTYIYKADVTTMFIRQPVYTQVRDIDMTGEFWLTRPTEFTLHRTILLRDTNHNIICPCDCNNANTSYDDYATVTTFVFEDIFD